MKKIISLLLLLSTLIFSLASCDAVKNLLPNDEDTPEVKERTATFNAGFDIGLHVNDKAVLLLSGSTLFFNPENWNLKPLVAGDVVTVTYKGTELLIQETYPSTVVTDGIEILNISVEYADTLELTAKKIQDLVVLSDESGQVSTLQMTAGSFKRYIIFEDDSFEELSEKHVGRKIYATGKLDGGTFTVAAYYAYNPRNAE